MKTHIFRNRPQRTITSPLVWIAECGREIFNGVESAKVEEATCGHCLRSRRDRALRIAVKESEIANTLTVRLESMARRRSRRGKR